MPIRPTPDEFRKLAGEYALVPVWREVLADSETPLSLFRKLGTGSTCFLLETVEAGERWGRYSFIGVDPFTVMTARGSEVTFEGETPGWATGDDPLQVAASAVAGYRAPALEGLPPLHGGAVGYFAYDAVRHIETLPDTLPDELQVPDIMLQFTSTLVAYDHFRGTVSVIVNARPGDDPDTAYRSAVSRCDELIERISQPLASVPSEPPQVERQEPPDSNVTPERWREMIAQAKKHIVDGDIFQVVLSQRFKLDGLTCEPLDIYRMLRLVNPSPYMYLLRFGELSIVGSSPEALVRVEGTSVITHPIAGTRWRGLTAAEDEEMERELLADPKERAEHVMLVDLARNDLGRVCEYDSVHATRFMTVERFSHLMHIVSEVVGELKPGLGPFDVLRATFPAGTVSGAPKVRAMEIIEDLEPSRRGVYAGVVGYVDFSGNMDTAIALRTAVLIGDTAYVQAGGGIVADSDPDDEYRESLNKASALLNAIRAAEAL